MSRLFKPKDLVKAVSKRNMSSSVRFDLSTNPPPFKLNPSDHRILAMKESDFHRYTWAVSGHIIRTNSLEQFKRTPYHLREYLGWSSECITKYGATMNYLLLERLKWMPLTIEQAVSEEKKAETEGPPKFACRNSTPFADPDDYTCLTNDWPYGLEPGIAQFVIWLKTPIATDPETGEVTPASRELIELFVDRFFVRRLKESGVMAADEAKEGRVLWFKNWARLQSVKAIEHIHVLVKDAPFDLYVEWARAEKAL